MPWPQMAGSWWSDQIQNFPSRFLPLHRPGMFLLNWSGMGMVEKGMGERLDDWGLGEVGLRGVYEEKGECMSEAGRSLGLEQFLFSW